MNGETSLYLGPAGSGELDSALQGLIELPDDLPDDLEMSPHHVGGTRTRSGR